MKERLGRVGHYTLKTLKAKPHRCPQRPWSLQPRKVQCPLASMQARRNIKGTTGRDSSLLSFGRIKPVQACIFLPAKNSFLPSKGKETPSIEHRWHWTWYPGGYKQHLLCLSSGYLILPAIISTKFELFLEPKGP